MNIRTSNISFCNKVALNLTDDKFKAFLLNNLRESYHVSITDKHAYILNKKSIQNLSKNQHLISVKTGGTNYYLYLTCINEINYSFFIDKKIKNGYSYPRIILVNVNFHKELYKDTLVEGELVRDVDQEWVFILFDLRCYKGVLQKEVSLVHKIRNMYAMLSDFEEEDTDICKFQVKRYFHYSEFDYIQSEFIPSLPYKVTGLFFNTLTIGHHNYLHFFPREKFFKKKNGYHQESSSASSSASVHSKKLKSLEPTETHDHMVFVIKKTEHPDVYHLYCIKENSLVKYGVACVPTLRCSKLIRSIFINSEVGVDVKVQCKYHSKFGKWQPEKLSEVYVPSHMDQIKRVESK